MANAAIPQAQVRFFRRPKPGRPSSGQRWRARHDIALIHLLAFVLSAARGGNWRWWVTEFPKGGVLTGRPPGYGYGLAVVWCVWIFVVVICYPACKWYAGVKRRSPNPMLSYL
jgi:hypothetical protein